MYGQVMLPYVISKGRVIIGRRLVCLFDLILYVPSTIFQLNRNGLPGLNQY